MRRPRKPTFWLLSDWTPRYGSWLCVWYGPLVFPYIPDVRICIKPPERST